MTIGRDYLARIVARAGGRPDDPGDDVPASSPTLRTDLSGVNDDPFLREAPHAPDAAAAPETRGESTPAPLTPAPTDPFAANSLRVTPSPPGENASLRPATATSGEPPVARLDPVRASAPETESRASLREPHPAAGNEPRDTHAPGEQDGSVGRIEAESAKAASAADRAERAAARAERAGPTSGSPQRTARLEPTARTAPIAVRAIAVPRDDAERTVQSTERRAEPVTVTSLPGARSSAERPNGARATRPSPVAGEWPTPEPRTARVAGAATLEPNAPSPPAPDARAPQIVIGRIRVEVVPPAERPAPVTPPRAAPRPAAPQPGSAAPRSMLRFGLGQL